MSFLKIAPTRVLTVLVLFAVSACSTAEHRAIRVQCDPWNEPFFFLSREEGLSKFEKMDIDTQYRVLFCGMRNRHHRRFDLVEAFAKGGIVTARYAYEKLQETQSEGTIITIIWIFYYIAINEHYDTSKDTSIMELIVEKTGWLNNRWHIETATGLVNKIRQPSDAHDHTY